MLGAIAVDVVRLSIPKGRNLMGEESLIPL
jgi:hypothetical protein